MLARSLAGRALGRWRAQAVSCGVLACVGGLAVVACSSRALPFMAGAITASSELPAALAGVPKDRIVHLKGYGVGKLVTEEYDEAILADLRDMLGEGGVVAWDGDFYHPASFTRVLDKLLATTPLLAVAFCHQGGRRVFEENWGERVGSYSGSSMHVVLLDGSDPRAADGVEHQDTVSEDELWLELGRIGLQRTGASQVVSIGGGGVAAMEAAAGKSESTRWLVYKVHRGNDRSDFGALYEEASAAGWPHVEIRVPRSSTASERSARRVGEAGSRSRSPRRR